MAFSIVAAVLHAARISAALEVLTQADSEPIAIRVSFYLFASFIKHLFGLVSLTEFADFRPTVFLLRSRKLQNSDSVCSSELEIYDRHRLRLVRFTLLCAFALSPNVEAVGSALIF